jgi:sodium/potassium-transporting ATPase subunit alpha
MAEFEDEKHKASRIHWTDADLEFGARPPPTLRRSNSNISINSMHSRRGSIDPASALPIQYRTVSIQIDESKEKYVAEIQKVKDSATKGPLHQYSQDLDKLTGYQNSQISTGIL